MKTEAEILKKQKEITKEKREDEHILFGVIYVQDSDVGKDMVINDLFTNAIGLQSADYDMDVDKCFAEAESVFYDKLGFVKKEDSDSDSEEEESKSADKSQEKAEN